MIRSLMLVLLLGAGFTHGQVDPSGEEIKVTFKANTAGVPDLINENSTVQIRGNQVKLGQWSSDSPAYLTNVGGDYWETTIVFDKDELTNPLQYKYATARLPKEILYPGWSGWEAGANRTLDLSGFSGTDTTLNLEFVKGWAGSLSEEAPFRQSDSIDIYFRVNLELESKDALFNAGFQRIGIRGAREDGGMTSEFNWAVTQFFSQETDHVSGSWASEGYDGSNFWSGTIRVPVTWSEQNIQYKFVMFDVQTQEETWETLFDASQFRILTIPATGDTTVAWVRWNDRPKVTPGTIINISEYGDDLTADGSSTDPFYSINYAILHATDTDTILVAPGIYYENVDFDGKNIFLTSFFHNSNHRNDIKNTVLNGDEKGSVVSMLNNESNKAVLKGFTIRNGLAEDGGGINIFGASPTLEDLIIKGNTASGFGGGIYAKNSHVFGQNLIIQDNFAISGGGLALVNGGEYKLKNISVLDNSADSMGGGIYLSTASSTIDSSMVNNNLSDVGGGIYIESNTVLSINNSDILNNEAVSAVSGGGGIQSVGSYLFLEDVRINQNTAPNGNGGGIFAVSTNATGSNLQFEGNNASTGGGVFIEDGTVLSLMNTDIINNEAYTTVTGGGGIRSINSSLYLEELEIKQNNALNGYGAAINFSNKNTALSCSLNVINTIIDSNYAAHVAGIDIWSSATEPADIFALIKNSKIKHNQAGNNSGFYALGSKTEVLIDSCLVEKNITEGPRAGVTFVNGAKGRIIRSIIFDNNSFFNEAPGVSSGLSVSSGASVQLIKSAVVANTGGLTSGLTLAGGSAEVINSFITHNDGIQVGIYPETNKNTISMHYSGLYPADNSLNMDADPTVILDTSNLVLLDPLYIDLENGNFHLNFNSPAVDAGAPDLDNDGITWESDPDDQDPDGSRLDIGLYSLYSRAVNAGITLYPDVSVIGPFDTIKAVFTLPLNPDGISNFIYLTKINGDSVGYKLIVRDSVVLFMPEISFRSNDSLLIHFEVGLTDTAGSLLKYNSGSENFLAPYVIAAAGDFNFDGQINFDDLVLFSNDWGFNKKSKYDLYPYDGNLNDLSIVIKPDDKIDYDDLLVFVYAWNYSSEIFGKLLANFSELKTESKYFDFTISPTGSNSSLPGVNLDVSPKIEIKALEFIFNYNDKNLDYRSYSSRTNGKPELELNHHDKNKNRVIVNKIATNDNNTVSQFSIKFGQKLPIGSDLFFQAKGKTAAGEWFTEMGRVSVNNGLFTPEHYSLGQNFPNPFNPVTTIPYSVPEATRVKMSVYDLKGHLVNTLIDKDIQPGFYQIRWNGRNRFGKRVSAGMYICRFESPAFSNTVKLLLLK